MSTSEAPFPEGIYEVTGQSSVTKYQDNGPPMEGIEVRFTIPSIGVSGSVWIPGTRPDPEIAQNTIRDWVLGALEIATLNN